MNSKVEIKSTGGLPHSETFSDIRWSWKKLFVFTLFMFAAHVAFVFLTGSKRTLHPRAITDVPRFQLASDSSGLLALDDPTLFALPHVEDFVPAIWRQMPEITGPSMRWTEQPPFLPPAIESLGASFNAFMASNRFDELALNFKPAPQLSVPDVRLESMLPKHSSMNIEGALAGRQLLKPVNVPTLAYNDIIAPSRVQVLVDRAGNVISAVLLPSESALENAGRAEIGDASALRIVRKLHFAPAPSLTLGELVFNWHVVPVTITTNTP